MGEFLAESFEGLDRMELCLTELEAKPADGALIDEIFRVIHTVKGSTGFLGFARLERMAHAGENVMGALRARRVGATAEVISGLLGCVDRMRLLARLIEQTELDGAAQSAEDAGLLALLGLLSQASPERSLPGGTGVPQPTLAGWEAAEACGARAAAGERSLRVEVEVLNRMMNLVGELVLTRNQVLQSGFASAGFGEVSRRLDEVTSELRTNVMQARMQPLAHLFGKLPRMARDLALSCGKEVTLILEGQETCLDKSLIEVMRDPLTHALRNAIDHGIEAPERRVTDGKQRAGKVRVRAFQQHGSVVIEMEDDGAGVSRARVLAKAIERRLVQASEAATMSAQEVLQLIFLPGLSTSAEVTLRSGRGVGMDVVKSNVERAGGAVDIVSTEGKGTVLRIRVPLTLAIMPALVVVSGGRSLCIPENALREVVHLPWEAGETMGEEIFELRGELLPLLWLDHVLEVPSSACSRSEHGFYVVVLEVEWTRFGVAVHDFLASEEIVVKALPAGLREIGIFSGVTVLGTGELALILDPGALAARAAEQCLADDFGCGGLAVPSPPLGSGERLAHSGSDPSCSPGLMA